MSSHIRFYRTIRNTVLVQTSVHTDKGLKKASQEMLLEKPDRGFSGQEAKTVVGQLLVQIDNVRANASKAKMGGE